MGTNKIYSIKEKIAFLWAVFFLFTSNITVLADDEASLENSNLGKGLKNLLNDASAFLLLLSPIIGICIAVYFFIRKSMADEQDQKQWNKRLVTTGICTVGAVLVSSMLTVLTGYFQ